MNSSFPFGTFQKDCRIFSGDYIENNGFWVHCMCTYSEMLCCTFSAGFCLKTRPKELTETANAKDTPTIKTRKPWQKSSTTNPRTQCCRTPLHCCTEASTDDQTVAIRTSKAIGSGMLLDLVRVSPCAPFICV